MRQLLPEPVDPLDPRVFVEEDALLTRADRPVVTLNMVASVDGATAVEGRSGALGGAADKAVFRALRATTDVILVAAGTVRAEGYGPPRTSAEDQDRRRERGQRPFPRIAVISGSLDLEVASPMFTEAPEPPLVLTAAGADPARKATLDRVAEVVELGEGALDLRAVVDALHDRGVRRVLCEGGPTLNGQLVAAGLVDAVHLSLSSMVVGGTSRRVAEGEVESPTGMRLVRLGFDDGDQLLVARYERPDLRRP